MKIKYDNSTGNIENFFALLELLFIGLKLAGVISWSWVWVLSPTWVPLLLFIFLSLVFAIWEGMERK